MPRPRDHRDVTFHYTPTQPVTQLAQFDCHFDPEQDYFSSSMLRKVSPASLGAEQSQHEARVIVGTLQVGTIQWDRLVRPTTGAASPHAVHEVVEPTTSVPPGWPSAWPPSGPIDRQADWDLATGNSHCRLRLWVRPASGVTSTISPSASPPYAITFRHTATGAEYRFLLDASVRTLITTLIRPRKPSQGTKGSGEAPPTKRRAKTGKTSKTAPKAKFSG